MKRKGDNLENNLIKKQNKPYTLNATKSLFCSTEPPKDIVYDKTNSIFYISTGQQIKCVQMDGTVIPFAGQSGSAGSVTRTLVFPARVNELGQNL